VSCAKKRRLHQENIKNPAPRRYILGTPVSCFTSEASFILQTHPNDEVIYDVSDSDQTTTDEAESERSEMEEDECDDQEEEEEEQQVYVKKRKLERTKSDRFQDIMNQLKSVSVRILHT